MMSVASLLQRAPWAFVIAVQAASVALALGVARPSSVGSAMHLIIASVLLLGLCFRAFEYLLWLRFPTKEQHARAGVGTFWAMAGLLVLHVALVIAGV